MINIVVVAEQDAEPGQNFADGFHTYELTWSQDSISLNVDGKVVKRVDIPKGGFPELDGFLNDIYKDGGKDAPFDDDVRHRKQAFQKKIVMIEKFLKMCRFFTCT